MKNRTSPGYRRAVRAETREWLNSQHKEEEQRKADDLRKEREDELTAVLAELPINKSKGTIVGET